MLLFVMLIGLSASLDLFSAQSVPVLTQQTIRTLLGPWINMPLLNLRYHNVSSIDSDALDGFFLVTYLDLSHNELASLQPDLFHDLFNLRTLDLSSNNLLSLNRTLFAGLNRLTALYLESNKLVRINPYTLVGLTSLRFACFFNNPVVSLFPSSLTNLCASNSECALEMSQSCFDDRFVPIGGVADMCGNNSSLISVITAAPTKKGNGVEEFQFSEEKYS